MFNSTYSAGSVRGWRNISSEIITPVTFTYIGVVAVAGSNIAITTNGGLLFSAINTTFSTAANTSQVISNSFTTATNFKLSNYPNPYGINGYGNLIVNLNSAPGNIEINQQTGLYTYSPIANINVGNPNANFNISDLTFNNSGDTLGVTVINSNAFQTPAGYAHIYNFDGANATLEANININPASTPPTFSSRINLNPVGNYAIITTPNSSNVQIWNKTGNTWALQANISNVVAHTGVINNTGNIIALNIDDPNQDITKIYTRSGNTWSLLQNVSTVISGAQSSRRSLDMTQDGDIIAVSVSYTGNNLPRVEILNYDSTNGNFTLTQTIFGNSNANQFGTTSSYMGLSLSKTPGYLIVSSGNTAAEIYSCL
jgi:hypothetical protein